MWTWLVFFFSEILVLLDGAVCVRHLPVRRSLDLFPFHVVGLDVKVAEEDDEGREEEEFHVGDRVREITPNVDAIARAGHNDEKLRLEKSKKNIQNTSTHDETPSESNKKKIAAEETKKWNQSV